MRGAGSRRIPYGGRRGLCGAAMPLQTGWQRDGLTGMTRQELKNFAAAICDKVNHLTDIPAPIAVPGDATAPYYTPKGTDGQPAKFLKAKPLTDLSRCTNCGACARVCPMGAIDPKDVCSVPGTCIKCQACVRKCTRHAKYFEDAAFLSHVAMLEQNFTEPKKNEAFL